MIGTTVSHYKILEKIGEGGMGEVYLAEDTKLKRQVSLKFLSADLTRDEDRKQRFIQEARAAAAIQHPHIAAVYDIDESEGRTFIAMEYIPGESLREVIEAKKLTVRRSLELATQIADGLAKAHERGVVHRDVKPENVLVSEDGYAKIIDFGLAKLLEPLMQGSETSEETATRLKTKEGWVMGTVAYMSPEQARGDAVDARSDIFSFGTLLYEMLSGNSPFRKRTGAESMSAVLNETPAPLTLSGLETPAQIQWILRKALAKEPSERYQNMKDLALDVKEVREEVGSVSRPAVVAAPSAAKPTWLWGAVAAGVLGLLALAFYLGTRQPSTPPGIGASGRPAIAVMYFESLSGDEEVRWLSKGLPNMLITDLAQTPGLDVVSSQRIHQILTEIGQEDLDTIDKSLVPEIAERAGAGAVVLGSIFKSGSEIRLDVQVLDVVSGRVLSAESVRGDDVFPLVDELTDRIRASLDLGDRPAGRPIAEVTTASLEALQLYNDGLEARRNFRTAEGRKLFKRAVELDPSYAMAYDELWDLARASGEMSLADHYREKTFEHLDRLPERQKLRIQATDLHQVQGKTDEAAEILESVIARYPDEEDAYTDLWVIYALRGELEKRVALLQRAVEANPRSGHLRNDYGYALLHSARYGEGIREFETYAELSPNEPNPYDSLGEAYLLTGQPEKALDNYTRALEVDASFRLAHNGRAWAHAMIGRCDEALEEFTEAREAGQYSPAELTFFDAFTLSRVGRYGEAQAQISQSLEEASSQNNLVGRLFLECLSAQISIERADYAEATTILRGAPDEVAQITQTTRRDSIALLVELLAGAAEARRGNLEAARAHLEKQREMQDRAVLGKNYRFQHLRGEIALATRDLAGAEAAFLEAEPESKMLFNLGAGTSPYFFNNNPFIDGPARVKKAQGDLAGAIKIYRKLTTPDISAKYTSMLEPRFVLELARLLDESGQEDAARAEYERFLELWKNADDGLPELNEARTYVGS